MKITPIEIRQHTFEKGLRGYKPEDVDAFLASLSQEWERVTGDHKMLKMQLELAEKELGKLKEVEMTLFRTLKTAEDTSTQITDQANKAAEQYVAEARQKADEMLADARKRSALMVQDAENQARYLKDNILNDLKAMEYDFKALETYKENLAVQIRNLASSAVDTVDRFEKKFAKQNLKGKIDEVSVQIKDDLKASEAPVESVPTDDLPPLTEREAAVPEAIPVDEALVEKLDEAIEQSTESTPAVTAQTESADDTQPTESAVAQAETPALTATSVDTAPVEVTENGTPRKSGSFFDQI
ncbi:DivIVA domain-containing protein [Spirosoma soli]|uniref:DivIVA domain-containing protein n=1 Tax=Spirosoma soli TaxID=1770529 RepID=A0ABW5M4H9_9BACT